MKQKAAEREAARKASERLGLLTITPCDDPLQELSNLAGEVVAWKNVLAGRVADLTRVGYAGATGEQVKADIIVFERGLDRCAHVLTAIAKLDIDDRLAQVRETQLRMLVVALTAALRDAGLDADAQREVTADVARRLRLRLVAG